MMGCLFAIGLLAIYAIIEGAFVWLAFWILHSIFLVIPEITLWQAVGVGIALSIIGSFFKSSKSGG
jgi:hypothetical protein